MLRALVLCLSLLTATAHAQELRFEPQPLHWEGAHLSARDVALRADLDALAERDRGRGWMGGLLLGLGALAITLGAIYPHEVGALFLPLGTRAIVRSTISITSIDDARTHRDRFVAISDQNERIAYGARSLARLAHQYRRARIADGTLSLLMAATYVPLAYGFGRMHDPHYRFGDSYTDYVLLALAALDTTTGILTFVDQTQAEQMHEKYLTLTQDTSLKPLSTRHTLFNARFHF
ncbi:MAG TPA: hypothetical protein VI299_02135 [Polyangiales bacterium]